MAARHNPRRNVGAPVRFEDDDAYLEPPRDTTKPAWPKLLAQSTVPYDQTLAPVKWNTRPLDQPCSPRRQQALEITQEDPAYETAKEEDYSKQLSFEANCDLDMSTSESEGEGDRKDHERTGRDLIIACDAAKWSSLEPALQLSIYEYVYRFLSAQGTSGFVEAQGEIGIRALAAEVLGLSSEELSEIDTQRAFLAAHPMTEDYIQALCWQHEETTMIEEDPLSKDICQYRGQWQEINSRYTALMLYICKYKYTNERAIHLAKEYVKVRGLKPKVVGKWTEGRDHDGICVFRSCRSKKPDTSARLTACDDRAQASDTAKGCYVGCRRHSSATSELNCQRDAEPAIHALACVPARDQQCRELRQ